FDLERRDAVAANAVIASEAKQSIAQKAEEWIASSLTLLAMTWMQYRGNPAEFNDVRGNRFPLPGITPWPRAGLPAPARPLLRAPARSRFPRHIRGWCGRTRTT